VLNALQLDAIEGPRIVVRRIARRTCGSRRKASYAFCKGRGRRKVTAGQVRTRSSVRRVRDRGERRIPPATTDREYTLAVLWYAVVRGVHLSQVDSVARINERHEEIENSRSAIGR
jgi:hypothetical protein